MISDLERLIMLVSRLPGLGPRSARRAVLEMIKRPEALMKPLALALEKAADKLTWCARCNNIDTHSPCGLCQDLRRDPSQLCGHGAHTARATGLPRRRPEDGVAGRAQCQEMV